MSPDPFDAYREQLVTAARRRSPLRWRRGLAVGLVGVSLAGTATAAVVATRAGEPSAPAAGPLPPARDLPPRSRTYAITVAPDLRAGAVGWCDGLQLRTDGRDTASGVGCGPAWTAAMHLYGGGTTTVPGGVLEYAVVPPDVATVAFSGGHRVAPRPERSLPYDWRIAVLPRPGARDVRIPRIRVLDARGRVLPQDLDPAGYAQAAPSRVAVGSPDLQDRLEEQGGTAQPDGPDRCDLQGAPRGFRIVRAAVATGDPKVPALRDPAFLTCAASVLRRGRVRLELALLLDAEDPARPAAPLPAVPDWSAKRSGPGWLVAAGGTAAQRKAVLAAARATIR